MLSAEHSMKQFRIPEPVIIFANITLYFIPKKEVISLIDMASFNIPFSYYSFLPLFSLFFLRFLFLRFLFRDYSSVFLFTFPLLCNRPNSGRKSRCSFQSRIRYDYNRSGRCYFIQIFQKFYLKLIIFQNVSFAD